MSAEVEGAGVLGDLHGNARARVLTFRQKASVLRAPSFRLRRAARVHARWTGWGPPPRAVARYAMALAPLGLAVTDAPRMHVPEEAEAWAGTWLAEWTNGAAPVALVPGARHFTKRWPESSWLELDDRLQALGRPHSTVRLPRSSVRSPRSRRA